MFLAVMAISLSLTLSDLDSVPTLLESIRLRCQSSSESKWLLWAEEWASKATQTLEQLAVHYEDEENVKETYKEPGVFRSLRLLETHLELLMGTEDLQKLFMTTIYNLLHPGMVDLNSEMVKFNYEMLELLLPMVDPSADGNYAIRLASQFGHVAVVASLLAARDDSGRLCVDPSANDNEAIRLASRNGHEAVVASLLAARDDSGRLCVDPSACDNEAIRLASQNGHVAVVGRLLTDPRVDPSALDNAAIQAASLNGHVAVVDRLLADPRVYPSARNNEALRLASSYGHKEVVALLKPRSKLNFFEKLWY